MASRPCVLVRFTVFCTGKLMVTTEEIKPRGCALHCCDGVGTNANSFTLTLFCALVGIFIGRSDNGEGVIKGTWFVRGTSTLGEDTTVDFIVATTIFRRYSCLILDGVFSRLYVARIATFSSLRMFVNTSK